MKTKKISIDLTFRKTTTEHKIELNDKIIRIYEHSYYSPDDSPSDDYDINIDDNDLDKLTEEEVELLAENLSLVVDSGINEEIVLL